MSDQNNKLVKILVGLIILLASFLVILGFYAKHQNDTIQQQKIVISDSVVEMKRLNDGIVRAQSNLASKQDIENLAKNSGVDLKGIQNDLKRLNADVNGISVVVANTPGYTGIGLPSTKTTPHENAVVKEIKCPNGDSVVCPDNDEFGYLTNAQTLSLNEPIGKYSVPIGSTTFKAWQKNPWDVTIIPRRYSLTTVLGRDENGKHYAYSKFGIEVNGKKYPVEITDAKFEEEVAKPEFRFSPRIYMGIDVGSFITPLLMAEIVPSLEVALFSYGENKSNPTWTFAGVGLGFASQSKSLAVSLNPINYNIAETIPLVENLYVGPSIMVTTNGGVVITGGLRVGL